MFGFARYEDKWSISSSRVEPLRNAAVARWYGNRRLFGGRFSQIPNMLILSIFEGDHHADRCNLRFRRFWRPRPRTCGRAVAPPRQPRRARTRAADAVAGVDGGSRTRHRASL